MASLQASLQATLWRDYLAFAFFLLFYGAIVYWLARRFIRFLKTPGASGMLFYGLLTIGCVVLLVCMMTGVIDTTSLERWAQAHKINETLYVFMGGCALWLLYNIHYSLYYLCHLQEREQREREQMRYNRQ